MTRSALFFVCLLAGSSCQAYVELPMARTDATGLSGSYSYFAGFTGVTLDLWPNGTYQMHAGSDAIEVKDRTNEKGKSYGSYSLRDGLLILQPRDYKRRLRLLKWPLRLIPVKWGMRLYLIEETELTDFCNAVARKEEPHGPDTWSSFLLRRGDASKPAGGSPKLPDKWLHYLRHMEEVEKTHGVTVVKGTSSGDTGTTSPSTPQPKVIRVYP